MLNRMHAAAVGDALGILFRQAGERLGYKLVVDQQVIPIRRKNVAVAG
ncbi:hypothetical protein, partial [Intestinimonas massiliensis (ex Afouda et al. 2020)]